MVLAGAFEGENLLDDVVRLVIVFIGITLALVCVRLAVHAFKRRETERVLGILSYGSLALSPGLLGLNRFGLPINWWSTTAYMIGLACGIAALSYRVVLSPPWRRIRHRWHTRAEARQTRDREREDTARKDARLREDVALKDDRVREDDATSDYRGREDDRAHEG